jgi:hypothetical protein
MHILGIIVISISSLYFNVFSLLKEKHAGDFELQRKQIISIMMLGLISSLISLVYVVILKKSYMKSKAKKLDDDFSKTIDSSMTKITMFNKD